MAEAEQLLDYLKKVTIELQDTRARLHEAQERATEPIAITGIGCRYPAGASSAEGLWELVAEGRDAICEPPANRGWALERPDGGEPDDLALDIRNGGFLHDAGDFDPAFFGIGSREALAMDPQQRLLLEASWEAIEHAGVDPLSLRGSRTGVFAGILAQDYGLDALRSASEEMQIYLGMSSSASMLSGRISYVFGLQGPAVTINTACSSSLVALHLACQALRAGDCDTALASGVTVNATPLVFWQFGRLGGLSPDGRCKSFAAGADGTGLCEGVGVLLLERLSDAKRVGHRVLGVVRGSAINQDGASNGITAPNGLSQQRVIRHALANADLSEAQVDAVEGHGTGTVLGDPIEADALIATYGQGHSEERPLWLGSIKSNLGHAQAAAGVAGVIKMVMAMRNGVLPKTLHVGEPSRQVDWSRGAVSLLTESRAWPANGEPRRAGVSSFGISGTNAHVIIEEAPATRARSKKAPKGSEGRQPILAPGCAERVAPWILAGKGQAALRRQAARLRERVDQDEAVAIGDVGLALATGRTAFEARGVLVGEDRRTLLAGLSALAEGKPADNLVEGVVSAAGKPVFVFPGQGSQWAGMAAGLLDQSAAFASSLRECDAALSSFQSWSVEDVLRGKPGVPDLEGADVVQPALFAVMVSLARLWIAAGASPSMVLGHSQGEIAAACVAGALSLEDAARVISSRGRALVRLAGKGGMASLGLSTEKLGDLLDRLHKPLSIAAVNGPCSVVLSGGVEAIDELLSECDRRGVRARRIAVDYAAHSRQVEEVREELLDRCRGVVPRECDTPFFSSVTMDLVNGADLDAGYWYRNLRESVQFEGAIRRLLANGAQTFIEISPHPVLIPGIQEAIDDVTEDGAEDERYDSVPRAGQGETRVKGSRVLGTLRRDQGDVRRFMISAGEAWVGGTQIDWASMLDADSAEHVELPTYAFARQRYWLESAPLAPGELAGGLLDIEPTDLSLPAELRAACEGDRRQTLINLVLEQMGAVLGREIDPEDDPEKGLLEYGLDSLTAVELGKRLSERIGLRVPTTVLFDHPTVAALAGYLDVRVSRHLSDEGLSGEGASNGHRLPSAEVTSPILTLFRQAHERGMMEDFLGILAIASKLRPTFDGSSDRSPVIHPMKLCEGERQPALICVPPVVAISGPHQYVRFAQGINGARRVSVIPIPGFVEGEDLPASVQAAIDVLADGVVRASEERPFILVGYSSGGLLAHAVAAELERAGIASEGVVVMDSYTLDHSATVNVTYGVLNGILEREGEYVSASDVRLTAMGAYVRLFSDWRASEIAAPTLLVRASEPLAGLSAEEGWQASWEFPHAIVDVPGNHFTMMESHAESTARAVQDWLLEITLDRKKVS